jgi:excisionase family DNA binding protein
MSMRQIPVTPIAVSPRDAARLTGVSRSRIYELINGEELRAYKDGRRTLILVADIEAWLARLKPMPKSLLSSGALLPLEERKVAQRRTRNSDTGPLLPAGDQERAIERAREPPPSPDQPDPLSTEPKTPIDHPPTVEPALDLRRIYLERLKRLVPDMGEEEGRLRAREYAINACRAHCGVDLETAKQMVLAALEGAP